MKRSSLAAAAAWAGLSACALHDVREAPPPPIAMPDVFSEEGDGPAPPERWWADLPDPALQQLIGEALSSSFDLRRAFARLEQAAAVSDQAGAAWWPQLNAEANASRARSVFNAPQIGERSFETNQFSLGLAASYELDIWGRVASLDDAAELELEATAEDLSAAALSVAAEVGQTWYAIVEQRAARDLLAEQLEANETYLELIELRFEQGLSSALDVFQQRQQVAATRAQVPLVESRLAVLEHQLAILLGKPPKAGVAALDPRAELPDLPPLPDLGLPAELVTRRPDVRAVQLRVEGADHRIAAAIADRFPAIRLTARTGFQASDVGDLFSNWIWNLAAGIAGPIFDGGRRAAEVERTKAVREEILASYAQVVLRAFKEVEDALVQESKQRAHLAELTIQLELARSTLTEARNRYLAGLTDYLSVLTALRSLQQAEQSAVSARRQLVAYRIQLYRALGGTWPRELERPEPLSQKEPG